ncbi:hypothetical protein ACIXJ9_002430 [Staphylococcus aureus]
MSKNIIMKSILAFTVLTTIGGIETQINKHEYTAKAYEDDRVLVNDVSKSPYNAIVAIGNNRHGVLERIQFLLISMLLIMVAL